MNKKPTDPSPTDKDVPVWRETPLDHWTSDIDPVIMAGDEWVDNNNDPGALRIASERGGTVIRERFMHPTHDTGYGVKEDGDASDTTSEE